MNIIYRELDAGEISASLFQTFIRRQVVNLCYRRPDATATNPGRAAGWVVRPDPFVDDWTDDDRARVAADLLRITNAGGLTYGAFASTEPNVGRLIGFVSVEPEIFGERRYMDLSHLHVSADLRGRGIGGELFAYAKLWAAEHGALRLYISAHSALESQNFYRRRGCIDAVEPQSKHIAEEPFDCQLECDCI